MADNNDKDLVHVLDELSHALKDQRLDQASARKADKAILAELRKKNRYARRDNSNVVSRVSKKAGKGALKAVGGAVGTIGKAAGGFIGKEIGGIPIAGAIFRILGKKFANAALEKKQYKKTLIVRRKLEIKEMERLEKIRAKLDAKRDQEDVQHDEESPEHGSTPRRNTRGEGMAGAVEKMANAAIELQATVISMTPAIQTFHETVAKMSEVVDEMHDQRQNAPGKVNDGQLLEYLRGIEYLTQESAAIAENSFGVTKDIGKDISNIKWHASRQNNTVGRIEKLMINTKNGGNNKILDTMSKDVGTIKWHIARISGSSSRTEKFLSQAANDRIQELANQQTQIKLQSKQLDAQDEANGLSMVSTIAGAATSAISGVGSMVEGVGGMIGATALGGAVIAALPEILGATAVVAGITALAGGVAYGIYKLAPDSWFNGSKSNQGDLSALTNENMIAGQDGMGNTATPTNPASPSATPVAPTVTVTPVSSEGEWHPVIRTPVQTSNPEGDGDRGLTQKSSEVDDAKSDSGSGGTGANINTSSTNIQNQTTVQPGVVSASPYDSRARQRDLS